MKTTNVKTPLTWKNWRLFLLIAIVSLSSAYSQVGIGTTNPDASAVLDISSTELGVLPPRLTTAERDEINTPAEGLFIFNTDLNCLQFWNGIGWFDTCQQGLTSVGELTDCPTIPLHLPADQTKVQDVLNASTNKTWMDRNLGAYTEARSSTDCWAYGSLYQWGRAADGHESRTSSITSTNATTVVPNAGNSWDGLFITEGSAPFDWLSSEDNTLWQGLNATNNPCPAGYRVPTEAEWNTERLSWTDNNAAGAIASPLKLPVAGGRGRSTGGLGNVGSIGNYWSSTVSGSNAQGVLITSTVTGVGAGNRANGFSVRCIKGEATVLGANGVEWLDRNLGATQVATSSTDADSYGDLYQWGRAADGHEKRNSTATAGTSTSTSPGANFLTGPANWYTGSNPDDLWKEDGTGVNNPCPAGFRLPTEAEWDAERISWGINSAAGAFASPLKLPLAGVRNLNTGNVILQESYGVYWSSTVSGNDARRLLFDNTNIAMMEDFDRTDGNSLRCLKD